MTVVAPAGTPVQGVTPGTYGAPAAPSTITTDHLTPSPSTTYPTPPATTGPNAALGASLAAFGSKLSALSASLGGTAPNGQTTPGSTTPSDDTTTDTSSTDDARNSILQRILGDTSTLGTEGDFTTQENNAEGIAAKTKAVNDLTNEYNTRSQYYNDAIAKLSTANPLGQSNTAITEQSDQLTRQKNQELADIAVQQSAANGDLTTANTIAQQAIAAKFQPLKDEITNLTNYYNLTANDMTDSEKQQAQAAIDAKQATLSGQISEQEDAYKEKIQQADPLYQAQLAKAQADAAAAKGTAGVPVVTGDPAVDLKIFEQNATQNAADAQTLNSNYQQILGILKGSGITKPIQSLTAADLSKLSNSDQASISKALARVQNPDVARLGGSYTDPFAPVGAIQNIGDWFRQTFTGSLYDPSKVLQGVQAATALYNQRNPAPNTLSTTASGRSFDYAAAKAAGYSDQQIQAYIAAN
jgi:hypothetical protein